MTEQTQPTDAPLNSIELMKVVMQADEETRAFALRGTPNWAAHIGKAVQNAVLAKWGTPAGAGEVVAWLSTDSIGERYLCFTKPKDTDPARPLVFGDATPQPTQAQAGAVPLKYARLHAISLDYSNSEDECTGFRDGWRAAEKHHGIKGADHG